MNSRKCPNCNQELTIKQGQFVDVYKCLSCETRYKESELQQGTISTYSYNDLNILRYGHKDWNRTFVMIAGFATSSKKFFVSERMQRYCDQYGFNLIVVSKSELDKGFPHDVGYRKVSLDLIEFLRYELKIDFSETDFVSFSHGGVIHANIITAVKTRTNTFISSFALFNLYIVEENLKYKQDLLEAMKYMKVRFLSSIKEKMQKISKRGIKLHLYC
jgi:hypothetical protein